MIPDAPPEFDVPDIARIVEHRGRSVLTRRNDVELVVDGSEGLARRLAMIRQARHHLFVSTFTWKRDDSARRMLDAVVETTRARRAEDPNFDARVLIDYFSPGPAKDYLRTVERELRRAGVNVRVYNPLSWAVTAPFEGRLHEKVLIADGRVAMLSGRNIGDDYFDGASQWLDFDLVLRGEAVSEVQMHFLKTWELVGLARGGRALLGPPERLHRQARALWRSGRLPGQVPGEGPLERFVTPDYFPSVDWADGDTPVAILHDNPFVDDEAPTMRVIAALLGRAEREVDLLTPYPTLTHDLVEALGAAAARGVRVRIVVNARASLNFREASWKAGLPSLIALLERGVEVLEWHGSTRVAALAPGGACSSSSGPGAMLHGKAIRIDDDILVVHSSNFNYRSAYYNTEIGALVVDRGLAGRVRALVESMTAGNGRQVECRLGQELVLVQAPAPAVSLDARHLPALRTALGDEQPALDARSYQW